MPSVKLHAQPSQPPVETSVPNPLPDLLKTPHGLALIEIQGTLHLPSPGAEHSEDDESAELSETPVGRLEFPLHDSMDKESTTWMKRVYLYVGKHQRLTGEIKKLPKPIAIIRKRPASSGDVDMESGLPSLQAADEGEQDLEIVDVVHFKVLFAHRPEPVGS
ncbi:MAG: hypothetical protein Q9227_006436 [Pyrenula ochraceoflavens]